ncbi:potassium-transporting ATPase subunit KdpC [Rhodocyclus tenuis]|uniref:Potassium-transporting ATPase KdpC subunit n=1 Tax=Rhodocyclus tenuis TaxID=1066 RepID=A0A6L5JUG1_RHOTE|nr:potassium-transporting ATPase subunit KdpC [Rhodocyclus gracilis]MQY50859.1 potassium-transporting ATPase subunit KdpC [Rhodocyclus gracilis]MRD72833.1 potassium-transporting ATPase subunit KdpC [Rhodocyclus gracilis]
MKNALQHLLRPGVSLFILLTLVTGAFYPLAVTSVVSQLFPEEASGSLVSRDGTEIGSRLIGQNFSDPRYFWGRPSATAPQPNNATASGGSNLGPLNPALVDAVQGRVAALKAADPENDRPIPVDLVTASGSGLDPHISPAAADWQVQRVAKARGLTVERVRALVEKNTEGRQWGVFGEPRVNVLALNLALDATR